MVFASSIFLFWFLALFLAVYYLPLPLRARNLWLIVASFTFYGWWLPYYCFLMLGSTMLDWLCGRAMGPPDSGRPRRLLLVLSITANLGLLGYFKYANLLVESWGAISGHDISWQKVVLPVGISFYTFQSMSYTIDVYRGLVKPVRSMFELLSYVTMFPQLVAGPIVRYVDVQDQVTGRVHSWAKFGNGVFLLAIGFAKKVLIADQVAPLANAAFATDAPGLLASWTGVVSYAVQIYFDFSGYSDMAIGLGLMIGFDLVHNFLSPYKATSITDFWRRWHVSLSTWLRDYLYIPLGGNRRGPLRTYVNLMTTMLLGGLWHGAQWTFLLWGAWQGLFLAIERRLGKAAPYGFLPRPLQVLFTFLIVLGGWVVFRADDMAQLLGMWRGMVGLRGVGAPVHLEYLDGVAYAQCGVGLAIAFLLPRSDELVSRFRPATMVAVAAAFALAVAHLLATNYHPFLYFQF
jgi:alginate O-acetyltransferase complex protein AlgI